MARAKRRSPDPDIQEHVARVRQNIRKLRKDRKLTAMEVAARMGISRPFYTQLEGGTRRLGVYYLLAMAKAMGVPAEELLR